MEMEHQVDIVTMMNIQKYTNAKKGKNQKHKKVQKVQRKSKQDEYEPPD